VRAPLFGDLVQALPVFRLAANSRFQLFALLALALLAGAAIDALRSPSVTIPRGWAWRFLLAMLLLVAGAMLGLWRAAHDGLFLHYRDLVPVNQRMSVRATVDRVATDDGKNWTIVGRAAPARPPAAGALLYGKGDAVPAKLGLLADPQVALGDPAAAGTWIFTATVPASQFVGQGLFLLLSDERGAQSLSSGLRPRGLWEYATAFPSMPLGEKGFVQLGLLVLASLVFAAAAGSHGQLRAILAIVAAGLVVITVGTFSLIFHPTLPPHLFYPATPAVTFLKEHTSDGRILMSGVPMFHPEVATFHGIRDAHGYDALSPARVELLLREAMHLSAQKAARGIHSRDDLRTLGLMAVKYLDRPTPKDSTDLVSIPIERTGRDPLIVYENPGFLPRARLVSGVAVEPDDRLAVAMLQDPSFDPRTTVLLAGGAEARAADGSDPGSVRIETDRPDRVRIAAQARTRCHLVLADTYFPGWKAFVDDREVPMLRANFAFRAVALDPGPHVVEFRYEPRSFRLGLLITLTGAALMVLLIVLDRTRRPARS
jgi:hypothetical protein